MTKQPYSIRFMLFLVLGTLAFVASGIILGNLTDSRKSQDVRSQASDGSIHPTIRADVSPNDPKVNQSVTVDLKIDTKGLSVDGIEMRNLMMTDAGASVTGVPGSLQHLASGLSTILNAISSISTTSYNISYLAILSDFNTPFSTSGEQTFASYSFTPTSVGSVDLAFDVANTIVTESGGDGSNILAPPSNVTINVTEVVGGVDSDGDGVEDSVDNCPNDVNSSQTDTDGDGIGDVCDSTPNGSGVGGTDPTPTPTPNPSCDVPFAPARITAVSGASEGEIAVRWVRPGDQDYFAVSFGKASSQYEWGDDNIGDTRNFTIRFLEPGVRYYIVVSAVNECGGSAFSPEVSAVATGGSFVYIPKGVEVKMPLQAYFRINAPRAGQFERTLIIADEGSKVHYVEGCTAPAYSSESLHSAVVEIIVKKGARVQYTTVQNWYKTVYNLVTKRAWVEEEGEMVWTDFNMGSKLTMKYPSFILAGKGARGETLSMAMAGKDQHQDTGSKAIHLAPYTTSTIISKSISKDGGRTSYRGKVSIGPKAHHSKSKVICDALLLDPKSRSDTYPTNQILNQDVQLEHEASVSKIGEEQLFYLMSRGLSEEEAGKMIVSGFVAPLVKKLPLEYAVEMNRLIDMEMEGSIG